MAARPRTTREISWLSGRDSGASGREVSIWAIRGARPRKRLHGRRQAAHELVVVVGIQNIVFAVVLGLRDQIDALEALGEIVPRALAFGAAAIGEAAPVEIDIGKVAAIAPATLVHQRLQAGAVGAGLRAEHAIRGAALRRLAVHPTGLERLAAGCERWRQSDWLRPAHRAWRWR